MRFTGVPVPVDRTGGEVVVADAEHAFPCRQCLTDARVGEELLLLSYDPWTVSSPYRQSGPVFVHREPCQVAVTTTLPEQQRRRLLSLRSFDDTGHAVRAEVVPGAEAEGLLERLLDEAAFVHVHNAGPGCFAVRVDR